MALPLGGIPYFQRASSFNKSPDQSESLNGGLARMKSAFRSLWASFRNDSDWSGELLRKDGRWKLGAPPPGNANYAWIQHFLHHLKPAGTAGFVLAKFRARAKETP